MCKNHEPDNQSNTPGRDYKLILCWIAVFLLMPLGSASVSRLLPSVTELAGRFHAPVSDIQLGISCYMMAFGGERLVAGGVDVTNK